MSTDGLKLTTYFGERDRSADRFLADALLDVYARHGLATSILVRGAGGFGLRHHLRTDRLLTLSEDLPLVSVAVDTSARIDAALDDVIALKRNGLITLERARLVVGANADADADAGPPAPTAGPDRHDGATKLTVYLGRRERVQGVPAFVAVCALLHRRGIDGATVLLGVDGTAHGTRARAQFFDGNADVPMMVIAVGADGQVAAVLPELARLLPRPLLTLERARICKRDGRLLQRPPELPGVDEHGLALWQELTVYTSEQARVRGRPVHHEIVRRLREGGHAGATTLRGIWGFHGDHLPHGDRLLQLRRRVPTVTIVVDSPQRIASAFAIVDELTPARGLVTSEVVPAVTALTDGERRGGLRLAGRRRR